MCAVISIYSVCVPKPEMKSPKLGKIIVGTIHYVTPCRANSWETK
jgi:hypothetical protein